MSTKEEDLFILIQSLTPNEKRYFKLFALGRKKNNNEYVQLFNSIEQNTYPLTEKEAKNNVKNISTKKHYLYDLVLNSLKQYYHKETLSLNTLIYADILIYKNLYRQANNVLEWSLKTIVEQEKFGLEILIQEKKIEIARHFKSIQTKEIHQKILILLEKQKNANQYALILNELSPLIDKYSFVRNVKQERIYEVILSHELLKNENMALSLPAKMLFYQIHYLIRASLGKWKSAHEFAKKAFLTINHHPYRHNEMAVHFFRALSNYMGSILLTKKGGNEFKRVNRELKLFIRTNQNLHFKILAETNYYQFQMIHYILIRDYETALTFVEHSIRFIEKNAEILDENKLKHITFDIAKVFFRCGNYRKAFKWFHTINYPGASLAYSDLYVFSRILSLFCLILQGETEFVKQNAALLKKQLKQLDINYSYESIILSFITKRMILWPDSTNHEKQKLMQDLKLRLQAETKKRWSKNAMIYFNFFTWIDEQSDKMQKKSS